MPLINKYRVIRRYFGAGNYQYELGNVLLTFDGKLERITFGVPQIATIADMENGVAFISRQISEMQEATFLPVVDATKWKEYLRQFKDDEEIPLRPLSDFEIK